MLAALPGLRARVDGVAAVAVGVSEFIAKRTLLIDRLLELWRKGEGPDPTAVLAATDRVPYGLAAAVSAVPPAIPARAGAVRRSKASVARTVAPANPSVRFPPLPSAP